jgi:hypothetical protein
MKASALTPLGLWRKLQTEAGLELKRGKTRPGRDHDLQLDVLEQLQHVTANSDPAASVHTLLQRDAQRSAPTITVESLLSAVLAATKPYAGMMNEIYQTLSLAGAQQSGHELRFEFRFDAVSEPIRTTLQQFREEIERTLRVQQSAYQIPPAQILVALANTLGALVAKPSSRGVPYSQTFDAVQLRQVDQSGLDEMLGHLTEVLNELRRWARDFGIPRRDINGAKSRFPEGSDARALGAIVEFLHDNLDARIEHDALTLLDQVISGTTRAADVIAAVQPLLDQVPRKQVWVERTYKDLLDILRLPTWKKRSELYAVWVGTVLLRCAHEQAGTLTFNTQDGVLSFSFAATRLATYSFGGQHYDVWGELRSELTRVSSQRTEGIQPDFRVLESGPASANARTRLIVEVKHYWVADRRKFCEAVSDYAHSCPSARVLLVSHGPLNETNFRQYIEASLNSQIEFLKDATVAAEATSGNIAKSICAVLFPPRLTSTVTQSAAPQWFGPPLCAIRIVWDDSLQDIDLALHVTDPSSGSACVINYGDRGSLDSPPFARLRADVQQGPGEEVIHVQLQPGMEYQIVVTDYSKSARMRRDAVFCEITLGPRVQRIDLAPDVVGRLDWPVAFLKRFDGQWRVIVDPKLSTSMRRHT